MAIMDIISDQTIVEISKILPERTFTTLHFIEKLEGFYIALVEEGRNKAPKSWKKLIGKRLRKFATTTHLIDKISPPDESPARWRKR